MILLIGLAVGVDYSMFYLRREREERGAAGRSAEALAAAAATSGRAVLVSGITVMIAMAGMYLAGTPTFESFATGTILVVAVSMVGSLTVLPAMLSRLGDRVEKGRVPIAAPPGAATGVAASGRGSSTGCCAGPLLSLVLAAAGCSSCSPCPALGLHTASTRHATGCRATSRSMQTYDRIQARLPGRAASPATVVVQARRRTAPPVDSARSALSARAATPASHEPATRRRQPRPRPSPRSTSRSTGNGTDPHPTRRSTRCATRSSRTTATAAPARDVSRR